MKNSLQKYLIEVLIVLAGVCVVDKSVGLLLDYLWSSIPLNQDMGKAQFARTDLNTEIVIVGSSRASHHYNSALLSEKLGKSVYNVGMDGCFFLDNCCVVNSVIDRYNPNLIVFEIGADAMYRESVNHMEPLYYYYWNDPYVRKIIDEEEGKQIRIQLLSSLYRHNSNSFRTIGYGIKGIVSGNVPDPLLGYDPLPVKENRKMLELKAPIQPETGFSLSYRNEYLLSELLLKAKNKGINILLVTSPTYQAPNTVFKQSKDCIAKICGQYGFDYWDYSFNQKYLDNSSLFNDFSHLNNKGADIFSMDLADRLLLSMSIDN